MTLLPYVQKAMLLASLASASGYSTPKASSETGFFWVGATLGTISYLLIMAGVGLYLASHYELPIALMVTGLVIIFTMLVIILAVRYYKNMRQRRMQRAINSATAEITNTLSEVADDLAGTFKDNAGAVALAVAVLGFLSARKI